ncbi:CHY zinc finger protein [Shouchella hunanensis]|uniref:CHY zinc finger protein n=1 Tax=Shouchella hunanensis TaxID=766894 RepID=A0ABY7W9T6_9BACI|nr:CHY zinc finger protein [Shouchella hunanensis]WDF05214.1 CHY zinc finger protein [Shouchella hunanensis]
MKVVKGRVIDTETRCVHYSTVVDVVAIQFACCHDFYPCYKCHDEAVEHVRTQWSKTAFEQQAIMCGVCKELLTIHQYLNADQCPHCYVAFNPNCSLHNHLYFDC